MIDGETYYYGIARDISERKKSEKELKKQRDFLQKVIDSVPARIFWKDRNSVYLGCNTSFVNDCGKDTPDQVIGQTDNVMVWKEDAKEYRADDKMVMENGAPKLKYEEHFIDKNGDEVVWRTSKVPLKNDNGEIIGVLATSENITEEKKAVAELKTKQYYLENAQSLGKIGSWDLDIINDNLVWTDENYRIFDIPVGTPMNYELFINRVHPDDKEYVDSKWSAAVQGEGEYDINHRLLMDDGEVKWVREKANLIFDDNNKCIRGIGFTQDITERIKAENLIQEQVKEYQSLNEEYQSLNEELRSTNEELKEAFDYIEASERKFKSYIEHAPDGIFIAGKDGNYIEANPAACRITGYTIDELHQKNITDLLQKVDVKKGFDHFQKVKTEGYAEGELGYVTKGGENRFWHVAAIKLSEERFLGFVKDITEQKVYQNQLEKSEKRYRELVDTVNSGVAIYSVINNGESGADYIIRDFNQFALKHEKRTKEEVIGKSLKDIRPNIDEFGLIDIFREVWRTGEPMFFPASNYVDENFSNYYENRVFRISGNEIVAIYDDVTEREASQIKLAESESKLKSIIENSTNLFFTHSADHKLTFISPQVKDFLGYESDEVMADWTKFISDNPINQKAIEYTNKAIETGRQQPAYELEMLHKDGKKIIVEVREAPILENGKVVSVVGSIADITERKAAEQKIIAQNQEYEALNEELQQTNAQLSATIAIEEEVNDRFNKAMEASSDGIFDWNLITNEIYYSPRWKSLLGYQEDELPDDFSIWETLTEPNDVKRSWNMLNDLIDGKIDKFDIEFKMKHKNGHWVDIHSRADVFCNVKGKAVRVVGTHTDITQRKRSEALLKKSEQKLQLSDSRYRKAEEIGKVGNWEYDIQTDQFWASDQTKRIYGFALDDESFSTDQVESCIPERERVHQALIDLIENEEKYDLEFDIITNDKGERKTIISVAELIKDEHGTPLKVIGVIQDVTQRVQFENQLKTAKEKAEESDRLKSAFLANMSHEIRTPMNGILGFADLLKKPGLNTESQQKYIRIIEESGARMLGIINDIIDISKIEAGLMELNLKETNVNEHIEYIYTFFKPELEARGLGFSFVNAMPAKQAAIITDSEKLYAVFTNLMKNAIKYTNEGSIELGYELTYSAASNSEPGVQKPFLQFYVKDTGIGIPENRQEAVFERFVQADIEDKNAHQGAGLGLAITKNYVESLGGEIWVESEENKGSTFFFTLPYNVISEFKLADDQENSVDKDIIVNPLKILIAEDDEVSGLLLIETLSRFSDEILLASTGVAALDICRDNPDIDLILMDIQMPEMGGYDAVKEIRSFNNDVVIIAQTAYGLEGDREKSLKAGCNDYIAKPINKTLLYQLIFKYFGKHS